MLAPTPSKACPSWSPAVVALVVHDAILTPGLGLSGRQVSCVCVPDGRGIGCVTGKQQHTYAGRPGGEQFILEPGTGHFRDFEFPRVHTRINSWGLFLAH